MKNQHPLRCVVVEDVPDEAQFLVEHLQNFPQIECCGTASEVGAAVRLIVSACPHLVFLDMSIIGGSGFTVLDKLSAAGVPIPLVVVTSAFDKFEHERQNRYAEFFIRYFEKPFADSSFLEKLEEVVHAVWAKTRATGASAVAYFSEKRQLFLPLPGGVVRRFDAEQIVCLFVKGRDLTLHTTIGKFEFRGSLNRFLMSADLPFLVRISSSEAVNLLKIIELRQQDDWRIKLDGFAREPMVSENYRREFLEALSVLSVG